jgi:MoCo/4Fe-4S cofactor protein with predicted Tat translocation signal
MTSTNSNPDLEAVREQLRDTRGQKYWRSLDQLADTPAFRDLIEREFPRGASEMTDPVTRRTFIKLMGASLALAGVSACTYMPQEKMTPYTLQPQGRVPGIPLFYASTATLNGYASGILVRSDDGRPTKIEGNPRHPASLGGTDIFTQANVLTMYDPDRSQTVLNNGAVSTWAECTAALGTALSAQAAAGGSGIRLLTTNVTSPTLADQITAFLEQYPQARWYQYEPLNRDNVYEGATMAFGEYVSTRYDFTEAQVVVSLDADFLAPGPGFAAYARTFADGRRVNKETEEMNRLYVVEAMPSSTGVTADHRMALRAGQIEDFARALANELGAGVPGPAGSLPEAATAMLRAIAEDLEAHRGNAIVIAGDQQPAAVHAIAHLLNAELGNVGSTVFYTEPVEARAANQTNELAGLVNEMIGGQVELLIMLGGNPVYDAPGDLRFAEGLERVGLSVHQSLFVDETSVLCDWQVPASHFLESWSDARAFDGTASIVQPLIEPLYGSKNEHEVLAALLGDPNARSYDIVRAYWSDKLSGDFETAWQVALSTGIIPDTEAATVSVEPSAGGIPAATAPAEGIELVFRPDPSLWDGSFTNNGWLMELPRPMTKLVWDNAALMSPRTAINLLGLPFSIEDLANPDNRASQFALEQLSQANGSMINLQYRGGSMDIPVWIVPGHVDDSITINLGYGRSNAGRVGDGVGINAYPIRTSDALWFGSGAEVRNLNRTYQLVSTQDHWTMEGRDIYRVGIFEEYKEDPYYIKHEVYEKKYGEEEPHYESLQPPVSYEGRNAWGLSIDLTACIGCNVCTVACQAENNIPIVGKGQVAVGREMHWIRIDRYYAGTDLDNPTTYMMPVACVQCEQAPCEVVCPVAATVHDYEGINNMVYNRCVGTKYCSNNCPYKVRRFNFLQYNDITTVQLQLARNPEVSVRNRGVMEKCTYCVQRISAARIAAKKAAVQAGMDTYTIEDGAIVTACEAACPTGAIVFGDINDESSRVAKLKADPRNYGLLGELNLFPRTTYLARIRNPNEELEG